MRVKAPAEKNFRRPRKRTRRSRFRPHLSTGALRRLLMVGLLVFGIYESVSFAFTTPLLRVGTISVRGNSRLSSGQVEALVEDLQGSSILTVDLEAFRRRLIESPWVADVALRRVLPSTIEVLLSERTPIGLCRLGQDLYLVDETGTIIDQFGPHYAEFDLPIIDGLVATPTSAASMQGSIDPARAGLAARAIAALGRNRDVAARLAQVDVTDAHDAVVLLDGDLALLHLGDDRFLERVQSYLELAGALRERVAHIDYVDLRFDRRVYVRPAADENRPRRSGRARAPSARQF